MEELNQDRELDETQVFALMRSPEQISGWPVSSFPDEESVRVSHETIYKSLYIQSKGLLNKGI